MVKFRSWNEYEKVQGFPDLRRYKIPPKEFKMLWELQKYLRKEQDIYFSLNKENQKINKNHWNELKILSSKYQQWVFSYPLDGDYIITDNIHENKDKEK